VLSIRQLATPVNKKKNQTGGEKGVRFYCAVALEIGKLGKK